MNILSCSNLSKSYKSDFLGQQSPAINNLSISVESGEILGIIGPNGAGKSTTLKIFLGFVRPDTGVTSLFGYQPEDSTVHNRIG